MLIVGQSFSAQRTIPVEAHVAGMSDLIPVSVRVEKLDTLDVIDDGRVIH